MRRAYLSLGSNQGDRLEYLRRAVALLNATGKVREIRASSVYETAPVGYTEQAPFLNMILECRTKLTPLELLHVCQAIEAECGRYRSVRWGPRTLDIDIVSIDATVQSTPELTLPHPRAHERAFVLVPLLELDPNAVLGSQRAGEWLAGLGDEQAVTVYSKLNLVELIHGEDKDGRSAGFDFDR